MRGMNVTAKRYTQRAERGSQLPFEHTALDTSGFRG
jgi:hypothetical protein